MSGNDIVLYITLGFMLICFVVWLWQSIVKRRRLEDDIAQQRESDGNDDSGEADVQPRDDEAQRK
ncbi:MAG TPA: hypothetical protein IAC59_01065 [Candidatus Fimadaptatus faecigallinarum]|uniref:Uncharacterized protein n=1 Tax=Candidatus Fimadaptatus faecigallinarum TaxID=2840814 RepID=A0A9D1S437_9FIRM|nr:hypothetical protein [Candidatus Fimadaptatus faecigallinarum]